MKSLTEEKIGQRSLLLTVAYFLFLEYYIHSTIVKQSINLSSFEWSPHFYFISGHFISSQFWIILKGSVIFILFCLNFSTTTISIRLRFFSPEFLVFKDYMNTVDVCWCGRENSPVYSNCKSHLIDFKIVYVT